MAYLQLSLLHVPAVIVHGNTLSPEEWSHWHTPAHILGFWNARLKNSDRLRPDPVPVPPLASPARPRTFACRFFRRFHAI